MLHRTDVTNLRRSAAMSPLSPHETERILASLDELLAERERIVELLTELPRSWVSVRTTLNELTRIIHPGV